jgi:hypothetical protein
MGLDGEERMTKQPADSLAAGGPLTFDRLIVAVLFVALLAMAVRTPVDTDTWWHLGAGRAILTGGRALTADVFSFTVPGRPWTNVQWLAQVGLYALHRLGGDVALALWTAALAAAAFALVYPQMEGPTLLRAFVVVLAATASSVIWSPRPQMLTFAFLAATGYVVYLRKWRQVNRLWLLPPLFALWGNVHGGYALGLMLIGSVIMGESLNRLIGQGDAPEVMTWREIGLLAGVGVLCGLALLISPYGFGTWALPFHTVGIRTLQGFIQEWASPDFHNLYEQPLLWLVFALLVVVGFSRRAWDWSDLVTALVFGYSAFLARRNMAAFALVVAPVLTRQAAPVAQAIVARVKLPAAVREDVPPRLAGVLNGVILALVIVAALIKCGAALMPNVIDKAQRESAPVRAVEWLRQNRLPGPMFNSYNWGGYLVWALPQEPVFVDGRTDVYAEFLNEYVQAALVRPGWQQVLDRYHVRFALLERDCLLATMLEMQPGWRVAYRDEQAVILARGDP